MNPPVTSPELAHKLERTDQVIKYSIMGAVALIVIALIVIIFQLVRIQQTIESNLVISRAQAAENHKKTQQYVRCVAETLLKPISQRNKDAFDKCGIPTNATDGKVETNAGSSGGNSTVFLPQGEPLTYLPSSPNTATPSNPTVTTSDPPEVAVNNPIVTDPDPDNDENERQPGLVSGLVLGLGGLVNRLGL